MRKLKGQLISVDLLIGILAAVAVFSIGVNYYNSITNHQIHTNSAIFASNLILQGQNPEKTCYIETTLDGIETKNTCQEPEITQQLTQCKTITSTTRFTTVNLTEQNCNQGCTLEVKTCED